jgi:hypothetical protein
MGLKKRFILGIIISIVAFSVAFYKVDLLKIWESLNRINPFFLLPVVGVQVFSFFVRGNAWRYYFKSVKSNLKLLDTTCVYVISLMFNNILPARMGDLIRAYLLGKKRNISKIFSLSTVILEKALDLSLLFFGLIFISLILKVPSFLEKSRNIVGFALLSFSLIVFLLFKLNTSFDYVLKRTLKFLPTSLEVKILRLKDSFIEGIKVFKHFKETCLILFSALLFWSLMSLLAYLLLLSCGIKGSFLLALIIVMAVSSSKAIPFSPGALGVFHLFCIGVLGLSGVDRELALSYAILLHGVTFLNEIVCGLLSMWLMGITFSSVKSIEEEIEEDREKGLGVVSERKLSFDLEKKVEH